MYAKGLGVEQNYKVALDLFLRAANQYDPEALYNLGLMYKNGTGVRMNYGEALRWFRMAAAQGYPLAQQEVMLLSILHDPRDD